MPEKRELGRETLPMAEPTHVGLTTYDAKDPDTAYPPNRAATAAGRCPERPGGPHRRRRLGDDATDADHLISPEERYRIAMSRQWVRASHRPEPTQLNPTGRTSPT